MYTHSLLRRIGTSLSIFLFLGLIVACDSTDNNGPDEPSVGTDGVSEFSITGSLAGQYKGGSFFATSADAGEPEPGLGLFLYRVTAQDTSFVLSVSEGSNATPSAKTYKIVSSDNPRSEEFGAAFFQNSANSTYLAGAENGTLTITSTGNDQLKGSFSFNGQGVSFSGTQPTAEAIQMNGTFTAVHAKGDKLNGLLAKIGFDDLSGEMSFSKTLEKKSAQLQAN